MQSIEIQNNLNPSRKSVIKRSSQFLLVSIWRRICNEYSLFKKKQKNTSTSKSEKIQVKVEEPAECDIFTVLVKLNYQERMDKAIRHFWDASLSRTSRHDIDGLGNRHIRTIWVSIMNSSIWSNIFWMLSIGYQIQTFFEPVNRFAVHNDFDIHNTLQTTEIIILSFFLIDIIMNAYLNINFHTDWSIGGIWKYQKKFVWKIIFNSILLFDFMMSTITYPNAQLRFGRVVRPLILISYSKELRRNIKGFIGSLKNLFIIMCFTFIVMGIWTFIGINLLGEVDQELILDEQILDYSDFFKLFNMLNLLSRLDFYPDIMMPSIQIAYAYSGYFIPYIFLFMFLLAPIPLAIVYEGFRQVRMDILITDRIKQRESLFACFLSLDFSNQGYVSQQTFNEFINQLYQGQLSKDDIYDFYILLDDNESGKISIEEFFNLIKVIDENKKYTVRTIKPLKLWVQFTEFMNTKLHLKQILEGDIFSIGMFIITMSNCSFIIAQFILDDSYVTFYNVISILDIVFFSIYITEMLLKVISFGIYEYFEDSWNFFDFILLIFQIIFDYILLDVISKTLVSSFRFNRFLRLAKIQKVFRLFRALRTIKIMSVFMVGIEIFGNVRDLFIKIMICIPVVFKQITTIWIVFYIYGIFSVELFSNLGSPYYPSPYSPADCSKNTINQMSSIQKTSKQISAIQWGGCYYADFNSLWGSMLLLLQIYIGNLSPILLDISHKIDNTLIPSLYFGSFVFLSLFLLTLLSGLIWEVFTIVEDVWKLQREQEQNKLDQKEEEENENFLTSQMDKSQIRNSKMLSNRKTKNLERMAFEESQGSQDEQNQCDRNGLDVLADENKDELYFSDRDNFQFHDTYGYAARTKSIQVAAKSQVSLEVSFEKPLQFLHQGFDSFFIGERTTPLIQNTENYFLATNKLTGQKIVQDFNPKEFQTQDFQQDLQPQNQDPQPKDFQLQDEDFQPDDYEASIFFNEDKRSFKIQESFGEKQKEKLEQYLRDNEMDTIKLKCSIDNTILSSTKDPFKGIFKSVVMINEEEEIIVKKNNSKSQRQRDDQCNNLLNDYLNACFIGLHEFSQNRQSKQLSVEGIFYGKKTTINKFFIGQVKVDLRNFEELNKLNRKKDVNMDNHRFLIENAILKGANQKEIRKKELNHFFMLIGHEFEKLREMKVTSRYNLISSSKDYFTLVNSVSITISFTQYFEVLGKTLITNTLLPGTSFCKFVFGDEAGRFFYFTFDDDRFRVNPLISEAWQLIGEINKPKNQQQNNFDDNIHVAYDIFNLKKFGDKFKMINKDILSFFRQVRELGGSLSQRLTRSLEKSKFYCLVGNLQRDIDISIEMEELNRNFISQFPEIQIRKIKYFQVWVFIQKSQMLHHQIFKEEPIIKSIRLKNSLQKKEAKFSYLKSFMEDQDQINRGYFKDEDQYPYLPFPYVIELMKDLLQVMKTHQKNLFIQTSQFIHLRRCEAFKSNLKNSIYKQDVFKGDNV